jgi:uncharacterized protein (TIGR02145 family)
VTTCVSSNTHTLEVNPKPVPTFVPCFDQTTTSGAKKLILRGASPYIPGQGIFSGTRVSQNLATGLYEFNPAGASTGVYPITYSFRNQFGCNASAPVVNITVQNTSFNCGGDLIDVRDNKTYKTAMLGGKCWMRENLVFGKTLTSSGRAQTDNCVAEKYCSPSDATCLKYGGYYQWDEVVEYNAAQGTKGICPPEWHVPTEAEWQSLIDNLISGIGSPSANAIVSGSLKDTAMTGGFSALLKGLDYNNNYWAFFSGTNTGTMFWTSTPDGSEKAIARGLNIFTPSISRYHSTRGNAFSMRCVKD